MAERTPAEQVEFMTSMFEGVDQLITLMREQSYDFTRNMAADATAAFLVLENDRGEVPDEVTDTQTGMTQALLQITRTKMNREWSDLDTLLFGIEVGETVMRIHHQAAEIGHSAHLVAVSILALMIRKPELYVETLRVRNPEG